MSPFSTDVSCVTIDVSGIAGSCPASLAIRNKLIGKDVPIITIREYRDSPKIAFTKFNLRAVSSASLISFCIHLFSPIWFRFHCKRRYHHHKNRVGKPALTKLPDPTTLCIFSILSHTSLLWSSQITGGNLPNIF